MDFVLLLGYAASIFAGGAVSRSPLTDGFALHELVMDQNNLNSEQRCVKAYSDLLSR